MYWSWRKREEWAAPRMMSLTEVNGEWRMSPQRGVLERSIWIRATRGLGIEGRGELEEMKDWDELRTSAGCMDEVDGECRMLGCVGSDTKRWLRGDGCCVAVEG